MPDVTLAIADRGTSVDLAQLLESPRFLSLYDAGASRDWAVLGAAVALLGGVADVGLSEDAATAGVRRSVAITDVGSSVDSAILTTAVSSVAFLEMEDVGASRDVATLSYAASLTIVDVGASRDYGDFSPSIPEVREPAAGEVRGTVNLARNPSLESADVGLRDWEHSVGVTLTREEDEDSWAGTHHALAVVDAAAVAAAVTAATQGGLSQSGYGRRWVAAITLSGDAPSATLTLVLVYDDATTDEGDPVTYDATTTPALGEDWRRFSSAVVAQDPTKVLSRLDLVVAIESDPVAEVSLRLDGFQPEEAVTGGATSYADGDLGDGHWWVGAPGFSMSVRETGS